MLSHLYFNNFALISHMKLELKPGFTVITGDTGAGKSILLDAIGAAIGERVDAQVVRFGSDKADINLEFEVASDHKALEWLKEHDLLDEDEPNIIRLRRVISAEGRSKAAINNRPVSIGDLKALGVLLVQINGQHSQQLLLKPTFAQQWLDVQAGASGLAQQVKLAFKAWQHLHKQYQQSSMQVAERQNRIQTLQQNLEEFAPLDAYPYQDINQEFDELSHFEQLMQEANYLLQGLDHEETSVIQHLAALQRRAQNYANRSAILQDSAQQIEQAKIILQECTASLSQHINQQEFDPQRYQWLESQMAEFHRLARKHHIEPEHLAIAAQQWQAELNHLQALDDAQGMAQQVQQAKQHYMQLAQELEDARRQFAPLISASLAKHLKPLALPEAQFEFVFTPNATPQPDGLSEVSLHFSANAGIPKQPLHKVASGGELSRITLVMQLLSADKQAQQQLLIFDEVDVGIGGGTAEVVGRMLRQLSQNTQILSVTHQPQVAAQGHTHLHVSKMQGQTTQSQMVALSQSQRIEELARMSGGVNITEQTLAHAKALLDAVSNM